jgi:signal transduction histidine kinase
MPPHDSALPPDSSSSSPERAGGEDLAFDADELSSFSDLRARVTTVALLVRDPSLRQRLGALVERMGFVAVGGDVLRASVAVVTDAPDGAKKTVTELRARARPDAAIVVVLSASAPASEARMAYEAGALLCVREPVDDDLVIATLGAAFDLRSAKAEADDLKRQLDLHTHLASIGRVAANFTHELSNPLTALAMNLQVVAEQVARPGGDDTVRAAVADMGAALERIDGILTTVRSLARGTPSTRIEPVDLVSVMREARAWAGGELEGVDVQELVDEPVAALADRRLAGQIAVNLLTNAAHAARQLPSPRVRLHVYASGPSAILSVRDNGPGIPPDVRDRIFEPFFTTRRGQGGTGLGLALCREYASQMHARITLWTAPGRGACFRLHMPRA